ncbi:MAG: Lrp/AsnC ligand binding domain-containing protein [Thaumarchaeota archaeon]|nr:Lrp/AsnC ligand binding domain-containing protein [Nitrososphaerota archaeon]
MQAYILLNCDSGTEISLISELKDIPEVSEINGVWGKYDIFLKVSSSEPEGIDRVVATIRAKRGIKQSYTMHVLYGQGGSIDE